MKLRVDGLSWREIDGETVILDLHASTYFRANRAGTLLLQALTEECDRDSLVAQLAAAYDLGPDVAASDVDAFLAILSGRGLLLSPDA
jgi:coenzyme PQQ synthesis protein D (PqqD)